MRLQVGAATSPGQRRPDNQDFLLYRIVTEEPDAERDCCLFVAADGVGGVAGGAIASEIAARTVAEYFPRSGGRDPAAALARALRAAGSAVAERAREHPSLSAMATTLTAAVVRDGQVWMANVGDSRGYLVRDGMARQVTADHSYTAEAVREGRMSRAAAAISPYRHVITRSLGSLGDEVQVDTFGPLPLRPGDRLLLCTDGLTETASDEEIAQIIDDGAGPEEAARRLVDEANRRGGPDNISVIVVAVLP